MEENIVRAVVKKALEGSYMITITFKQDALDCIVHLLEMNRRRIISLNNGDALIFMAIAEINNWVKHNRTIMVTLTNKFDENFFVSRLHHALEKIEVVEN